MKRADHLDAATAFAGDPCEAFVALARDAGAHAIAATARDISERLDAARLRIAVVGPAGLLVSFVEHVTGDADVSALAPGDEPLVLRYGHGVSPASLEIESGRRTLVSNAPVLARGIRFVLGTPTTRWPSGRIDVRVLDDSAASEVRGRATRGGQLSANLQDRGARVLVLEQVERLAREVGADGVEHQVLDHYRGLCRQLWRHLAEQQRALAVGEQNTVERRKALALARALVEAFVDARRGRSDANRDLLDDWLALERRRFMMAVKTDAMLALADRIAQITGPRHELRRAASLAAQQIANALLGSLLDRLRATAGQRLASLSRRLLDDIEAAAGDLLETTPLEMLARRGPLRVPSRHVELASSPFGLASLADRIGLVSRKQIELAARHELVARLDHGSLQLTAQLLDDYDDRMMMLEQRVLDLLDGSAESIDVAAARANEARAGGADGLARARARITAWCNRLRALDVRLG